MILDNINFVLFFLLLPLVLVPARRNPCLEEGEGMRISAFDIEALHITHEQSTSFTWQAVRGTTDITIWTSDGLSLTTLDLGEGAFQICTKPPGQCSGAVTLLKRASAAIALASATLSQIWVAGRHKPTGILLLGLAALILGQAPDQCQSVPSEFLHVWIPTNLVTDLCVNDKCAPALCPLNTESEYSQMPSNNDIIFEDGNCNIRHPVIWEQWLEHNFGSNSQQDYLGDIDNDGLVNILEYHGKWAFEDAFLDVGPNVTRNPPVCNCLDAPGEQPGEPQVIPLTWDEVISESSDPK